VTTTWLWVIFNVFVLGMLALDLGVFHRTSHEVSIREAVTWTFVWIGLALSFNGLLWFWMGPTPAMEFLTGYLIEKALSIDNIFVFVMIFSYFQVPKQYQHRVLFWGVLGALLMRGVLIVVGSALIARFHWIIYLFGGFLVFTGIKMALQQSEEIHPDQNPLVRLVRTLMPVSGEYQGDRFVVKQAGKWVATPLLLVLIMAEFSDLIFAFDSIPAIFAVTTDAFLVYTSNVFAILGLRALYFLLAGVVDQFRYLKLGLSAVLIFVGMKMLLGAIQIHIPIPISLGIILGLVAIAVIASLAIPEGDRVKTGGP
jgi:tellurite resistance protein TerC